MAQKLDISTAREANQSPCVVNIAQEANVKFPIRLRQDELEDGERARRGHREEGVLVFGDASRVTTNR